MAAQPRLASVGTVAARERESDCDMKDAKYRIEKDGKFGSLVKSLRADRRLGLRQFCIAVDLDPSNWSKVERGLLPPPRDQALLERIAVVLGLSEDTGEWRDLFAYAAIDVGKIPQYILDDRKIMKRLPVFFRMASGRKPTVDDLKRLILLLLEYQKDEAGNGLPAVTHENEQA